jgi:lysophospholipase L1-like esterase
VLWAIALFALLELGLQVRSQLRFGQSVFNLAFEEPMYSFDAELGLKLLTPNARHDGSLASIQSNSMGLRSPDIAQAKAAGEYRVALVGASSIMGAYSKTNEHTLAAFLQARLRKTMPQREVHVINAGIAGASMDDQRKMLHYIAPLSPDLVIFYTGFNDLAGYCRKPGEAAGASSWRLPSVGSPSFLLSTDLLLKNTVFLRTKPQTAVPDIDPHTLDTSEFHQDVSELLDTAKTLGLHAVLATVARSYRETQPLEKQEQLAATALYYHPCFTLPALHRVHDLHNAILRRAARDAGVPLVDLANEMPGGRRYFADASHFSEAGERRAASILYEAIWGTATPRREAPQQ